MGATPMAWWFKSSHPDFFRSRYTICTVAFFGF